MAHIRHEYGHITGTNHVLLGPPPLEKGVPDLDDDFSDLEELQVVHVQGADRSGQPVVRVVDKFFPGAPNPLPLLSVLSSSWDLSGGVWGLLVRV